MARTIVADINPFAAKVLASSQLAAAQVKRAALYDYLRGLTDEDGFPDITVRWADDIASYCSQRVSEAQGFSAAEVTHINAEIVSAYTLELEAVGYFRSA